MSRLDYLASKYLTADSGSNSAAPKKRKRKEKSSSSKKKVVTQEGLILQDDDAEMQWGATKPVEEDEMADLIEGGEDAPVVEEINLQPRKAAAGWKKVGNIKTEKTEDEDAPVSIKEEEPAADEQPSRKRIGGLKSAAEVKADLDAKLAKEIANMEASGTSGKGAEAVYRDASGRRIDIKAYKAKMEKQQLEEERKKKEAEERQIELNKGLVQELEKTAASQRENEASSARLTAYADDKELNDELKQQELWHDPAAKFLSKQKEEKRSATGLKIYKGPYPPNRYNIPPGYRWDGVDRSNGFEARLLEKRAREKEKKVEEDVYASDVSED
ncbi:Pre-mRNA-splicing factor of RES complex-domain-containing protein [Myxozyma melibiosi]|uniref:Pre-mRNA-splicing factor CWC26 n=1 Tax=Myxozyma melibiosi TaxID=54550 RepID=A0ABR1F8Z6_9ASCO